MTRSSAWSARWRRTRSPRPKATLRRIIKSIEAADDLTLSPHATPADRPAGVAEPRGRDRRRDDAEEVYRESRRGGVPQKADRQRPMEVRAQRARRPHRVRGGRLPALPRHAAFQGICTSCSCRRKARACRWSAPARRRSPRSGRKRCAARSAAGSKSSRCPARCRRCFSSGAPTGRNSRTARSPTRRCARPCRWRSTASRSSST